MSDATRARHAASTVTIREMGIDDVAAVFHLGERLFTAKRWPNLYRSWDAHDLMTIVASHNAFCLVAVSNESVVGFALGSSLEKRGSAWRYGYLEWIGVDPSMNGHGIGKRLLNRLTERFIKYGARMMLVDTDMENQAAIRFFKAHGFGNAAPHVYMSRNLTAHPDYVRKKSKPEDAQAVVPRQRRHMRVSDAQIAVPEGNAL